MPEKSSFLKRSISKEDAIIQLFRPQLQNRVTQAMDIFERLVSEVETLVKLGVKIQTGGATFHVTPDELAANLDEFGELKLIAEKGREFLNTIGFESLRRNTPAVGVAPVGKSVDVQPIAVQLPGSEPLEGAVIMPKAKSK